MCLDRLRLPRYSFLEGALRSRGILLTKIENTQRKVQLRLIPQCGARLLEAPDSDVYFIGSGGRVGQECEGFEIVRLVAQHGVGLLASLFALSSEEVDAPELEPDFAVVGGELLGLQEIAKCLRYIAQLVVQQAKLPDCVRIDGVEPEHVPVLEDCFSVLLSRGIFVAALEMPSLLSFR